MTDIDDPFCRQNTGDGTTVEGVFCGSSPVVGQQIAKGITRRSSQLKMESYRQIWMNKGGG